MTTRSAEELTDAVFILYEQHGQEDYIGEPVSQLEHMCQSAQLAEAEGFDEDVILAAFFHDIGHLCEHIMPTEQMNGYGVVDHEELGAVFLREKGFSEKVIKLVKSHVQAKRYLTFKFPPYYNKLSEASKMTLIQQGGVMTDEEAAAFEADQLHHLYIKIREWDDKAKDKDMPLPSLDKYKRMSVRHLLNNT